MKNIIIATLLTAITLALGIYLRLIPLLSHTSDEVFNQASLMVFSKLKMNIAERIENAYSDMKEADKIRLTQEGFEDTLRKQSTMIRRSIDILAKELEKKFPDKKTLPYLLEADSYNFYRLTQNIARTGNISEEIKGSKYFNPLMLAPMGHWEPFTLLPFVGFGIYKTLLLVSPQIPLMFALGFTSLFLLILCVGGYFWAAALLRIPFLYSWIGSVFFVLTPLFLKRSAFGWYDNDPYNVLFPLCVMASIFLAFNHRSKMLSCLLYSSLSFLFLIAYALFWQGWVYLLAVIGASMMLAIAYHHWILKEKSHSASLIASTLLIVFGTFAGIAITFGAHDFFVLFEEGWVALKNFLSPQFRPWPDLYIGVGELRKASWKEFFDQNGGLFFLSIAAIGFLRLSVGLIFRKSSIDLLKAIVLLTLSVVSLFLALHSQRFGILVVAPLALLFPLGLLACYDGLKDLSKRLKLTGQWKILFAPCLGSLILILAFGYSIFMAYENILPWRPIYNDIWNASLTKIKDETPPKSIITSWWPPGHFITGMAQRRVTFDGATINNPQAYWVANLFLSNNERYASGILRMLNLSANKACDFLLENGIKLSLAVKKIKEIAPLKSSQARSALRDTLSDSQIDELLTFTHGKPPPSYLLIYDDLIAKNLELSFVGKWNFEKAQELQSNLELFKKVPPRNSKEYIRFLWDLVGGPNISSEVLHPVGQQDKTIQLAQNIFVKTDDMTCRFASKKFGSGIPQSLIYLNDQDQVVEKRLTNATLPFSLMLFREGKFLNGIVLDPRMGQSLLFRLYYFEGKGLKYFELFDKQTDPAHRTKIMVFRVNWEELEKDFN